MELIMQCFVRVEDGANLHCDKELRKFHIEGILV
jgi:hypothetical protein